MLDGTLNLLLVVSNPGSKGTACLRRTNRELDWLENQHLDDAAHLHCLVDSAVDAAKPPFSPGPSEFGKKDFRPPSHVTGTGGKLGLRALAQESQER